MNILSVYKKYQSFFLILLSFFFILGIWKIAPAILLGFFCAYAFHSFMQILNENQIKSLSLRYSFSILAVLSLIAFILILVPIVIIEVKKIILLSPILFSKVCGLILKKDSTFKMSDFYQEIQKSLQQNSASNIINFIKPLLSVFFKKSSNILFFILSVVYNITTFTISSIVFISHWNKITEFIKSCIPLKYRSAVLKSQKTFNSLFSLFLKNQMKCSFLNASIFSLMMLFIGCPYPIAVFSITFFLSFVPYFGCIGGSFFALFIAIVEGFSFYHFIGIGFVFLLGYILENYFFVPYLIGNNIGIHPLTIISVFPIFIQVLGITGGFVVIPIILYIKVILQYFLEEHAVLSLEKKAD